MKFEYPNYSVNNNDISVFYTLKCLFFFFVTRNNTEELIIYLLKIMYHCVCRCH